VESDTADYQTPLCGRKIKMNSNNKNMMFWIGLLMSVAGTCLLAYGRFSFQKETTTSIGQLKETNRNQLTEIKNLKTDNEELHKQLKTEVINSRFELPTEARGILRIEISGNENGFDKTLNKIFGSKFSKKVKKQKAQLKNAKKDDPKLNISEKKESDNFLLFLDIRNFLHFNKDKEKTCLIHNDGKDRLNKVTFYYSLNKNRESLIASYDLNFKINSSKLKTGMDLCKNEVINDLTVSIAEREILEEITELKLSNTKAIVSGQTISVNYPDSILIDNRKHKYELKHQFNTSEKCWSNPQGIIKLSTSITKVVKTKFEDSNGYLNADKPKVYIDSKHTYWRKDDSQVYFYVRNPDKENVIVDDLRISVIEIDKDQSYKSLSNIDPKIGSPKPFHELINEFGSAGLSLTLEGYKMDDYNQGELNLVLQFDVLYTNTANDKKEKYRSHFYYTGSGKYFIAGVPVHIFGKDKLDKTQDLRIKANK